MLLFSLLLSLIWNGRAAEEKGVEEKELAMIDTPNDSSEADMGQFFTTAFAQHR